MVLLRVQNVSMRRVPAQKNPPATEWAYHRDVITRLYINEDRGLQYVVAYMERVHDFRATQSMYKKQFVRWGLRKNNKDDEVMAIIKKKAERAAAGKKSVFRLRGKPVDMADVDRYLKRKGMSIEEVIASAKGLPLPHLEVTTPPPSPQAPDDLFVAEETLSLIQIYLQGSFEAGIWVNNGPMVAAASVRPHSSSYNSIWVLRDCLLTACHLFHQNLPTEAGHSLNAASACIKSVLLEEDIDTLPDILRLVAELRSRGLFEVIPIFVKQFAAMAQRVLSPGHPLGPLFLRVAAASPDGLKILSDRSLALISSQFEEKLGPLHFTTIQCKRAWITLPALTWTEKEQAYRLLLQQLRPVCGLEDSRLFGVLTAFADDLLKMNRGTDAERIGRELLSHPDCLRQTVGLSILARVHRASGRRLYAEKYMRHAIERARRGEGYHYYLTRLLSGLEEWLDDWGRYEDARETRAERLRVSRIMAEQADREGLA